MERTDGNRISKAEYFELREKRLKLVYKILYVVVAIWIALLLNISNDSLTKDIIPAYAFLLSITSLMIIKIIKYALMEFRCMKVIGNIDEAVLTQTEDRYDNIWKSFGLGSFPFEQNLSPKEPANALNLFTLSNVGVS